jgi:hypothetical protein
VGRDLMRRKASENVVCDASWNTKHYISLPSGYHDPFSHLTSRLSGLDDAACVVSEVSMTNWE